MREVFEASLAEAARCLDQFRHSPECLDACTAFADAILACYQNGNKVLIAGNGGSMADALHFAEEWTGRFKKDRKPYPAMALGESTHITCVGNDYGYDYVFSRMVEAFGKPGDLLVLLSTSGNSKNCVLAAEAGKAQGLKVVGFLGKGGGKMLDMCDIVVMAPGETSDRIQEVHMAVLHMAIEAVERALGH